MRFSLKNKIFVLYMIVIIISVTSIGYIGLSATSKSYLSAALSLSKNKTDNLTLSLEKYLADVPNEINYLSNFYAFQKYFIWSSIGEKSKEKKWEDLFSATLLDFLQKNKTYYKVRILDNYGFEKLSYTYNKSNDYAYKSPKADLQDKSRKTYYKEGINLKKGEFFISDVNLNEEQGKIETPYIPVIRFITPIIDTNGEKHGLFVVNVFANIFLDYFDKLNDSDNLQLEYFLISKSGEYIYSKDKNKLWSKQLKHDNNFNVDFPKILEKFKNDSGVSKYDDIIYSYKRLHFENSYNNKYLYVVSRIDTKVALSDLSQFKEKFLIILILVLVLGYYVVTKYLEVIIKPLVNVSKQLAFLSKGEVDDTVIEYKYEDEIKELLNANEVLKKSLKMNILQAQAVANGDFSQKDFKVAGNDKLGLAIAHMTSRLSEVSFLANELSTGNYDVKINVKSENDKLAQALIQMVNYLKEITKISEAVSKGDLNVIHNIKSDKDRLGYATLEMTSYLKNILKQTKLISQDDFSQKYVLKSEDDELGSAILLMTNKLEENNLRNKEEICFSDSLNELSNRLSLANSMENIFNVSLSLISRYINAASSVLYIYESKSEKLYYESAYCYIVKNENRIFSLGEGVIGQVAYEKKEIILDNLVSKNVQIQSALNSSYPKETFTFPMLIDNKLYAVIEFSTYTFFTEIQKEYIRKSSDILVNVFNNAKQNDKIKNLLEKSQKTNEELQANSEELSATNEQMEEQSELLEQQAKDLKEQNSKLEYAKKQIDIRAAELNKSNEYKSEFLANMSHELRTPLNSIILLSSLLEKNNLSNLTNKDIEKAKVINESGNELLRLINDILDLSKIEYGKMELIIDKIDSATFLDHFEDTYKYTAENKNIDFIVIDNYKRVFFNDNDRLCQVLRNLISNSFKFTKQGSITLEIKNSDDKDLPICLSVKDTGIGIAKNKQDIIFKAFMQADGSTSREYGGTGLGLSISKELAALMKGKIVLTSKEDEGSEFCILLPNLKKHFKTNIKKDKKKILKNSILIVEDDIFHQEMIYNNLKKNRDIDLKTASSVKNSLDLLKKEFFDLIIIDLKLEDGNGSEICEFIKNNSINSCVFIYTSKELSTKESDYLSGISNKIIVKSPSSYKRLEDEVNSFFSLTSSFLSLNPNSNIESIKTLEFPINKIEINEKEELINIHILENKIGKPKESSTNNLINKNVLIVDDDIKNIFVLSAALQEKGMNTLHAKNGAEAIDILKKNNTIDIVLMDIMMPIMNGYEAMEIIRKDKSIKHLPIIAVTAKAMPQDKIDAITSGADDYLVKPIDINNLYSMTSMWLNKKIC
ncbi:MAG: response regulator [Campylobacterales bacterium]|nr:response regulator [Campylobacterales bacterium]